jgi:CubicO group peptidase (beta-lactamase class C family)
MVALGLSGPGPLPWVPTNPESHGLSAAALAAASSRLSALLPHRYCFLVVKDGHLVHESYSAGNRSSTQIRSQSMGKTAVAALIGTLVQQKKIDIDTPLHEYGVRTRPDRWNATGIDFWPQVTARHLLSQNSGFGHFPPGTSFSYDDDFFIQHLSYLIEAVTGVPAATWARRHFAAPLGVPALYDFDGHIYDIGGNISAGGGQMFSCRDAARVGTLVLQEGSWSDERGARYQLMDADYARAMLRPAFPSASAGYGLLTWLNTNMSRYAAHTTPHSTCCSPRWGGLQQYTGVRPRSKCGTCCQARGDFEAGREVCNPRVSDFGVHALSWYEDNASSPCFNIIGASYHTNRSFYDDEQLPAVDEHAHMPYDLGEAMGQYAQYTFMVPSLNVTVVSMGHSNMLSADCWEGGYDDAWQSALAWRLIAPALQTAEAPSTTPPGPMSTTKPTPSKLEAMAAAGADQPTPTDAVEQLPVGSSCSCDCPDSSGEGTGFGVCVDVPADAAPSNASREDACSQLREGSRVREFLMSAAPAHCPQQGQSIECDPRRDVPGSLCTSTTPRRNLHGCSTLLGCHTPESWSVHAGGIETCTCPSEPRFFPCTFRAAPCVETPYYPTVRV